MNAPFKIAKNPFIENPLIVNRALDNDKDLARGESARSDASSKIMKSPLAKNPLVVNPPFKNCKESVRSEPDAQKLQ